MKVHHFRNKRLTNKKHLPALWENSKTVNRICVFSILHHLPTSNMAAVVELKLRCSIGVNLTVRRIESLNSIFLNLIDAFQPSSTYSLA